MSFGVNIRCILSTCQKLNKDILLCSVSACVFTSAMTGKKAAGGGAEASSSSTGSKPLSNAEFQLLNSNHR